MAEWLRRLTRNQMGSSRVGSNPTRSDEPFCGIVEIKGGLIHALYHGGLSRWRWIRWWSQHLKDEHGDRLVWYFLTVFWNVSSSTLESGRKERNDYPKMTIIPKLKREQKRRGHPGLNQGPLDLQSNALPLSYIPMEMCQVRHNTKR